ncbi:MAG: L,D-transpeptidase [Mangrovibacterium sp.]
MMEEENGSLKKDPGLPATKTRKGSIAFGLILAGSVFLFVWWMLVAVPWVKNSSLIFKKEHKTEQPAEQETAGIKELKEDIGRLQKKIDRMTPGGVYLIVNTSDNTFFLYKDKKLIRNGLCSTGSYVKLELNDEKNWVFETPKGVFTIKGKITSPVWRKPDWAFVEEGLPVPSANDPSRYEYGVLGDYALSLGSGYLIHGTLYKRFLGQPVTHGCIRMNDEDLEAVYQTLPIGAKVFIY